jgi:hypothetical protein
MSRYADIIRKNIEPEPQTVNNDNENERITDINEKPVYRFEQPPQKRRSCNYDRWEYSYFPYLMEMYRILCHGEIDWNPPLMHDFFRFIYHVSSGEISKYLEQHTEEQSEAYFKYLIKRNDF